MSAHPLQEIWFEFEYGETVSTVRRHMYHVPAIGDNVLLVEADEVFDGTIYKITWENEIVRIRVQ